MAITQDTYTGNGSNLGPFSFTFKWLKSTDIKVSVGGVLKTAGTHYNLQNLNYTTPTKTGGEVLFTAGNAPANGASIRIFRDTDDDDLSAVFSSGSAIRAKDLNDNFTQTLYVTQEVNNNAVNIDGSNPMVGNLNMNGYQIDNLGEPTSDSDAATKKYIDERYGDLSIPGFTRWSKTAVGGETTLSGVGTTGGTLGYSPNREQVYLNGAQLQRDADYTANNGTSIVLNVALLAGDVLEVICVNNLNTGTTAQAQDVYWNQSGSNAVTRTVESKLRDVVSVKDFGAVGDGNWDDTSAIQRACSAAKTVTFGSVANNYKVSAAIILTSGTTLELQGATITQASNQTPIFNASNTDNVTIIGGRFIGKSEASYFNSPSSQAICVKADNATDLVITGNRFENFYYTALSVQTGGNRIEFSNNNVKGPGSAVLGLNTNYRNTSGATITGTNLRIVNNDIYDTAQGIIVGQGSQKIIVDSNIIHDLINEHGIYADSGMRQLTISNNVICNTGVYGTGLKVQCSDTFGIQPQCIAITGNVISNTGTDGILIINTSATPTLKTLDVTISGNSVMNAGAYAIDVRSAQDCTVIGNTLLTQGQSGIVWDKCIGLLIADNYVRDSGTSGLRDLTQSSNVTVKNNVIVDCAIANVVGDKHGIFLNGGAVDCVIDGNIISDTNAKMQYGIYYVPALNSTLSLTRNTVLQATDTALRLGSTVALREYRDNIWNGTLAYTFNDPVLPVVASAATITLPTGANVVSISGTTNISTITTNGHSGRIVTLIFQDTLTVIRGTYLLTSQALGNFTTTSNDTLTLCCDGTIWYEISRSLN